MIPDMAAVDFSRDSRIRESLLNRIKGECFCALEDDELDFLNAAGPLDERRPEKDGFSDAGPGV